MTEEQDLNRRVGKIEGALPYLATKADIWKVLGGVGLSVVLQVIFFVIQRG